MNSNHEHCTLCLSPNILAMDDYVSTSLVKCRDCSFVFTRKNPLEEELKEYYDNQYERTRFFSEITRKRYEEWLDRFESFRKTGRLLDLGCGYGYFLEVAKEKGWEVYGVEISQVATDVCNEKELNVQCGPLEDLHFENDFFDVIISIEVIEHLRFPAQFVEKSYQWLRKGGMVFLTTPNFNAFWRYRLKDQYDVIEYPNHLCYFTVKTLKNAFVNRGFQKKEIKSTGISITRYKTSKGISNQEFVSETSDDEILRYKVEHNKFLQLGKQTSNSILNTFRIGDNLKGWFIKP